jgi:hypothetical protein
MITLAAEMPRAPIHRIQGGGHLFYRDAEVDPLIAAFAALARDDSD